MDRRNRSSRYRRKPWEFNIFDLTYWWVVFTFSIETIVKATFSSRLVPYCLLFPLRDRESKESRERSRLRDATVSGIGGISCRDGYTHSREHSSRGGSEYGRGSSREVNNREGVIYRDGCGGGVGGGGGSRKGPAPLKGLHDEPGPYGERACKKEYLLNRGHSRLNCSHDEPL